ncbi:hypothetical protein AB833_04310 [Chromatiales bacterium (ex Bugula neritina AB1)]|nr:hypothetical protein AB833_04310 [Chromatiales bacterium (ex Bugula neritina AB1)]
MKILFSTLARTFTLGVMALASLTGTSQAAGLMSPVNTHLPPLEIRSHHVEVTIEDGYTTTSVDQIFSNPHAQDLEATYHFPVPDKAAVSEFTVWIDGKPVIGEVLEKQQAQAIYEEEKNSGRETGIAGKNRHYNFEIKVSPVRAGQDTRIRLVYLQAADIDTGIGRYNYPLEDGGTDKQAAAFWSADSTVHESFSFKLKLRSGYPISGMRVPAHPQATVDKINDQEWLVEIGTGNANSNAANPTSDDDNITQASAPATVATPVVSLDKDIIVYWRLADNLPGSIDLITHRNPADNHGTFMMTLTPGDDLAKITEGRDWAFVLDMSGSMNGKYRTLVDGVQRALSQLNSNDRFRIILFNNNANEITGNWVNISPENIQHWSNTLAATKPGGGTNLYAGMQKGLRSLDADRTSAIVVVTDGEANVGTTEKKSFLELMRNHDVRLFTAVIGNGANRPLLEAMTEVSNGFAVSVSNSDDIVGKLMEFTSKVGHEALHNVNLDIKGIKVTDLTPAVTTSLYRGEQLVVFGHYRGQGEAIVTLSGQVSGEKKVYQSRFDFTDSTRNPELERLWAYAKILDLQNMQDYLGNESEYKSAIVSLAVENSLVTDHTSMVVMRDEQFEARGIERNNKQRRTLETQAATTRAAAPVVSHRKDTQQPAFKRRRPSFSGSGGGSVSIEWLLLLIVAGGVVLRRARLQN